MVEEPSDWIGEGGHSPGMRNDRGSNAAPETMQETAKKCKGRAGAGPDVPGLPSSRGRGSADSDQDRGLRDADTERNSNNQEQGRYRRRPPRIPTGPSSSQPDMEPRRDALAGGESVAEGMATENKLGSAEHAWVRVEFKGGKNKEACNQVRDVKRELVGQVNQTKEFTGDLLERLGIYTACAKAVWKQGAGKGSRPDWSNNRCQKVIKNKRRADEEWRSRESFISEVRECRDKREMGKTPSGTTKPGAACKTSCFSEPVSLQGAALPCLLPRLDSC